MDLFNFNPTQYLFFFVLLVRVSGLFVTAPIFSARQVPVRVRAGIALLFSIILFGLIPNQYVFTGINAADYFLLVAKELAVGLLLGIVPKLMFGAIEFAGTIVGLQMGFGIVNVVDPQSDTQISIIASFENLLATLLFVILDGHHLFLEAITKSYEKIPIAGFQFSFGKIDHLARLSADMVIIGFQLGAPLLIALFLATIIMGLMARSIPQMNIFVVGFPFTIGLGFLLLIFGLPYLILRINRLFDTASEQIIEMINIMAK